MGNFSEIFWIFSNPNIVIEFLSHSYTSLVAQIFLNMHG